MSHLLKLLARIGWARGIIFLFLLLIWLVAFVFTEVDKRTLLGDCLLRTAMNGVLVLALVPTVRAGLGLNFGIPLGIVCGLLGGVLAMEWQLGPWAGFWTACALGAGFATVLGIAYGLLLLKVKGQEMMVGIYVGFAAVAGMSIAWLVLPLENPEIIWPIGGHGVRNTLVLEESFGHVLDDFGAFHLFADTPPEGAGDDVVVSSGIKIPTGLILFWLAACALVAGLSRTRAGAQLDAAGQNPTFARASGVRVPVMQVIAATLSTVLAAVGILVYSQSYGFLQLYKAPLFMALPTVAALLIGGASLRRATIGHVLLGTFLFQSVITSALPVVNDLVANSPNASQWGTLPEIARLVISNGIIIYALTRGRR